MMALDDNVHLILGISSRFLVVSSIMADARSYVRISRRAFGADDWLLVSGWVSSFYRTLFMCIIKYFTDKDGIGIRDENSTQSMVIDSIKVSFPRIIISVAAS
jgi:hypothetical protein